MCDIKRGVLFGNLLIGLFLFLLVVNIAHAGYLSSNSNVTLLVNSTVDYDFYPSYLVNFTINATYRTIGNAVINSSAGGQCFTNVDGVSNNMTFDQTGQVYSYGINYTAVTLNENFTISCNSSTPGQAIFLNDGVNPVYLQYSIYAPYWMELELDNTTYTQSQTPLVATNLSYTVYGQLRNLTGISNATLTTATCFLKVNGTNYSMTYPGSGLFFIANVTFYSAGLYQLQSNCSVGAQSYLGLAVNQTVVDYGPIFVDSGLILGNTQGFRRSSLMFSDSTDSYLLQSHRINAANRVTLFNLSNFSQIYFNASIASSAIGSFVGFDLFDSLNYNLLYTDFAASGIFNLTKVSSAYTASLFSSVLNNADRQSVAGFYLNSSGIPSMFWTSQANSIPTSVLFTLSSSNFSLVSNYTGLVDAPVCTYDYSGDGASDIFTSGYTGSSIVSDFFVYNSSAGNFSVAGSLNQSNMQGACVFTKLFNTSGVDLFTYGKTQFLGSDQVNSTITNYSLISNFTTFASRNQADLNLTGFVAPIKSDVIVADFDNDGARDIIVCGEVDSSAPTKNVTYVYLNRLSTTGNFVRVYPFPQTLNISQCSLSALDYDNDGALDLLVSGVGENGTNPIKLYRNRMSDIYNYSAPLPPTQINVSYNQTTQQLRFDWTAGSDGRTPSNMLSYNIEVKRLADNQILLSRLNPISTNPAQGYYGNAGFRQWYVLNQVTDPNVQVSVQTLAANLHRSAFYTTQFSSCTPPASGIWNISTQDCALTQSSYGPNITIIVSNGRALTVSTGVVFANNTTLNISNGTLILQSSGVLDLGNNSLTLGSLASTNASYGMIANGSLLLQSANLSSIIGKNLSIQITSPALIINSNLSTSVLTTSVFVNATNTTLGTVVVTNSNVTQSDYLTLSFIDQFSSPVSGVTAVSNSSSILVNGSLLLPTKYFLSTSNISVNYSYAFVKSGYYNATRLFSFNTSTQQQISLNRTPEPISNGFDLATNVSSLLTGNLSIDAITLSSVANYTAGKSGVGTVTFLNNTNISFSNLSLVLNLSYNSLSVDTIDYPQFNKSIRVSLYGPSYTAPPAIYRDGAICSDCQLVSYLTGNITFISPHASNYSTGNDSDILMTSSTSLMQNISSNFSIQYVNVSNTSQVFAGICTISTFSLNNTNLVTQPLLFDGAQNTRLLNFTGTDTFNITISCGGVSGVEPISKQFTLTVLKYGIYFILEKSFTGVSSGSVIFWNNSGAKLLYTGLSTAGTVGKSIFNESSSDFAFGLSSSSLAVADLFNSGSTDLLYEGLPQTGSGQLGIYHNLSQLTLLDILSGGSVVAADFNRDGSDDILACGTDGNNPKTVYFSNNYSSLNITSGFTKVATAITNVSKCRISVIDVDSDGWPDIIISGLNQSSGVMFQYYNNVNGTLTLNQSFSGFQSASQAFARINGTLYFFISGNNASGGIQSETLLYNSTSQSFSIDSTHTQQNYRLADQIIGDIFNNNSEVSFFSGQDSSVIVNFSMQTVLPTSNTNLTQIFFGDAVNSGSVLFADILGNNNLDLFTVGQSNSLGPIAKLYRNTAYLVNPSINPVAPSGFNGSYDPTTGSLNLFWTPLENRTFNVRVGNGTNANAFVSGVISSSSNPAQGQQGNTQYATNVTWHLPDACLYANVQSVDLAYRRSPWSSTLILNNHSEVCDGYDNNCDGQIDEPFRAANPAYFRYNTTINGTSYLCAIYEQYFPQRLACNPDSTTSDAPGQACGRNGVESWNNATKSCDCVNQSAATAKIVNTNSGGSSAGVYTQSKAPTTQPPVQPPEQTTTQDTTQSTEQQQPATTPAAPPSPPPESNPFGGSSSSSGSGVSRDLTVDYHNGRTYVTEIVRNTQRTTVFAMTVRKSFPKSIINFTNELSALTPFTVVSDDPVVDFHLGKMDYLDERSIVYSVPGKVTLAQVTQIPSQISTDQALTADQIVQVEHTEQQKAAESLNVNVTEKVVNNQTQVTINLNLTENASSVQNVEIEQYIPKCLISEINQTVLAAGIDPALLPLVHIKEADPTIVWSLKQVDAQTQLTLRLNTLRSSDCNDTIKIQTLAQEYIQTKYEISAENLLKSVGLTLFVCVFYILAFVVSDWLKKEHEDEDVNEVVRAAMRELHRGKSIEATRQFLLKENKEGRNTFSAAAIDEALRHIVEKNLHTRHPMWHAAFEHSLIIFLFLIVFVIDILDFFNLLSGYLNWIQIVMAWILSLIMFYEIDLTKLLFNNSRKWINISFLVGLFCMYLKVLVSYAQSQPFSNRGDFFIFDLYVYIVKHAHFFNVTLFIIGMLIVLVASIVMAWTTPVKKGCLYHVFTKHPIAETTWQKIKRSLKLFVICMIFGYSLFNRVIEWLGVSIDNTIFVIVLLVILFFLASTTFIHRHKPYKLRALELLITSLTQNSVLLLFCGIGALAFIQPFLPTILSQGAFAILFAVLIVVALYAIMTGLSDHFEGLASIMGQIENVTTSFIKLFSDPGTIFLGVSGILLLQHIADLAIYVIPNITGNTNSAYSLASPGTLLGLFTDQSIIAVHLFSLTLLEKFLYGSVYAISIVGAIFLFLVPVVVWALYFTNRSRALASMTAATAAKPEAVGIGAAASKEESKDAEAAAIVAPNTPLNPSEMSVKDMFFEKAGAFKNICAVILIFAVPSILTLLMTKVLSISYVTGLTQKIDLGVVINAQRMMLTSDQVYLILIGFFTYILIAASLYKEAQRVEKLKSQLVSITLTVSLASLFVAYFIPYVRSIIGYIGVLVQTLHETAGIFSSSLDTTIVVFVVIGLLVLDLIIVYGIGMLILIFFGLPRNIKKQVVEELSHIPFFHHLFFLADSANQSASQKSPTGDSNELFAEGVATNAAKSATKENAMNNENEKKQEEEIMHLLLELFERADNEKNAAGVGAAAKNKDHGSANHANHLHTAEHQENHHANAQTNHHIIHQESAEDLFVKLLRAQYPYHFLSKALNSAACNKHPPCQTIHAVIAWTLAATAKGATSAQIVAALKSRSWRADIANSLAAYAEFVHKSELTKNSID